MLGGAATHFALAASFFDEVRAVGPVGDDFDEASWADAAHARHDHRRRRARRRRQDVLLGGRVQRQPQRARDARHRPQRLRDVRAEALAGAPRTATSSSWPTSSPTSSSACASSAATARFVAMDSMNLWIDIARDVARRKVIATVDCLILNDEELEQLTGQADVVRGRRRGPDLGPDGGRRQAGQVRRGAVHRGRLLRAARLPAGRGHRPDRRGRQLRRRLRRLRRRAAATRRSTTSCSRARWPTARRWPPTTSRSSAPSACARLTADEVAARVADLQRMTRVRPRAAHACAASAPVRHPASRTTYDSAATRPSVMRKHRRAA